MSAVEDIPYELIFAGQVREIQGNYPVAHHALINWGRWSRTLGIFPVLAAPGLWLMADQGDTSDWAPEAVAATPLDAMPAKAEGMDEPAADEKYGYAIDVLLHTDAIGLVWRQVLRAAYYTRELPEWQMPHEVGLRRDRFAGSAEDQFVSHLEAVLRHIESVLC